MDSQIGNYPMSSEATNPESSGGSMRMDRYLWHVRLMKTRSQATKACQSGEVRMQGERVKASRMVSPGDTFTVRRPGIERSYVIHGLLEHRVGAKEVPHYLHETTSLEVIEQWQAVKDAPVLKRDKGLGRPTKRDLRLIEKLFS
jgi:ribosome-associated heat shock protein Hsp15